ncbi:unnamed protein product [Rhizophagus irregularis]|uniref:Zinc-ribbon domain-containing protein n=1 Tax=Rhizophagus irregularis TaxID=588596 RepID=A0A2N1M547_9GLOM|nr:hypothetical protein RhiirC2_721652 [Rhizophagus irregularis]CAB4377457.1 unnamed protein product [Rhizophagus irregularis]CAB5364450.1 unnamed protein product [Rhizophagus irregularis]
MTRKLTLDDAIRIAKERNGFCLSTQYINCETPLLWKCSKGHEWYALINNVKNRRTWCRKCLAFTIEDARKYAEICGGYCLSTEYVNYKIPLFWECSNGHKWEAPFQSIKNQKSWCNKCRSLTLEDAIEVGKKQGLQCLSNTYINNRVPLQWRCTEGHEFSRNLTDMKRKKSSYCPHCNKRAMHNIEIAKKIAQDQDGYCLSSEYINNKSNLLWCCSKGHEWYACLNSIKNRNSWCQLCSKYKREKLCYVIVSNYLRPPSANRWPDFLKTEEYPTGLQLDIPYYHYGFAIEV